MVDVKIKGFRTKSVADSYFENEIKESQIRDGLVFKSSGYFYFQMENGEIQELGPDEDIYVVVEYPRGTGITVDSGSSG